MSDASELIPTLFHVIAPDGTRNSFTLDLPEKVPYELLRTIVEPLLDDRPMHRVAILQPGTAGETDMFVDKMWGSGKFGNLPVNAKATTLYHAALVKRHPDDDPSQLPRIHGTAVVFDRPVWAM
jgi:hypothetical protein